MTPSPLSLLQNEFETWCAEHGVSCEGDATNLLYNHDLGDEEVLWVSDFLKRWEAATKAAA